MIEHVDSTIAEKPVRATRRPSWGCWITILGAALSLTFAYLFILPSTALGGLFGLQPPLLFKRGTYLDIVNATKAGRLRVTRGVIQLSGEFSGATPGDEVLHEKRPDGREFFLFPVWYGRGHDLQGYLFTTSPLVAGDYEPGYGNAVLSACDRSMMNVSPKGGAWYWVIRRMD